MSKELVISSSRHETKVAILEDDQLVEIYFQRANEYSLAGSIHKGRVTRVLPGARRAGPVFVARVKPYLPRVTFARSKYVYSALPEVSTFLRRPAPYSAGPVG